MTELEHKAWNLYCDETAGSIDVRDFWAELSKSVQKVYLQKAKLGTQEPNKRKKRHKKAKVVRRIKNQIRNHIELVRNTRRSEYK